MRLFPARLLGLLLAAALSGGAAIVAPAQAEPAPVERAEVSTRQITQFHIGRDETRFGPLEFVGGLEMVSSSRNFGGFSAMRFLAPGKDFIGVADTGFWFFGRVTRDAGQRPTDHPGDRADKQRDQVLQMQHRSHVAEEEFVVAHIPLQEPRGNSTDR